MQGPNTHSQFVVMTEPSIHGSSLQSRSFSESRQQSTSNLSLSSLGNDSTGGNRRICSYFLQGKCRHGDRCRFSHDMSLISSPVDYRHDNNRLQIGLSMDSSSTPAGLSLSRSSSHTDIQHHQQLQAQQQQAQAQQSSFSSSTIMMIPEPYIVTIPPNHPVYSIDVECVATGIQHNARSVAQVALVDEYGRPILNVLIRQEKPVVSYLTPLTGLTKELIDMYGLPLVDAMVLLRENLPPHAILVGQNIQSDVHWLQLAEGVDYHSFIDLATLFRVWDITKGAYVTFSQDHCASVWMGLPQRPHHDAVTDACISIGLFNTYRQIQMDPNRLRQMQALTLSAPRIPGFSSLYPVLDGCW